MKKALIALGGNATSQPGDLRVTFDKAVNLLRADCESPVRASRYFVTPCFPAGAGPDYLNAAVEISVNGSPGDLLDRLHAIETAFGRVRRDRWGVRTLDLDLLAFGEDITPDRAEQEFWMNLPLDQQKNRAPDRLILPHPRLQDRVFVLVPLVDIAPEWVHPILGRTAAELLAALPKEDIAAIKPL